MYTEAQVKQYCEVLCFSGSPELFKELRHNDTKLATEITNFNVNLTLLESIDHLEKQGSSLTYVNVRTHLYYDIFKEQVEMSELEEKLSNLLPKLQENGLIDKMILTEAGRKIIQIKKSIFYQTSLVAVNLN